MFENATKILYSIHLDILQDVKILNNLINYFLKKVKLFSGFDIIIFLNHPTQKHPVVN